MAALNLNGAEGGPLGKTAGGRPLKKKIRRLKTSLRRKSEYTVTC
jgi:hypothetical protein